MKRSLLALTALATVVTFFSDLRADVPVTINSISRVGTNTTMRFDPLPGIDAYTIYSSSNLNSGFTPNTNFSWLPSGQPEVVVDNTGATVVGSWSVSSGASDRYGSDYRFKGLGTGSAYLQFTPNLPVAGTYQVYTWYSQGTNRTAGAPYLISYSGGSSNVLVNQKTGGGGWVFLGAFNFAAGTSGNVRISDGFLDANQLVMADAIRFVGVGLPTNTTNVITPQNYEWRAKETGPLNFYTVQATPMGSDAIVNATVLNRLTYGPTPDDLTAITTMGASNYIDQQLNFELLTETVTNSHTNLVRIESKFANPTDVIDLYISGYTYTTNTNGVITTNAIYASTNATIADLKAWHVLRAVGAQRQLLEVLLQFFENHFVTQYSKSSTFMNGFYNGDDGIMEDRASAHYEYWENCKWRAALLNPSCTFLDLLKISAESPAMIIYLDTAGSDGRSSKVPNENYARELLELFTTGVDNGYDQNDITVMSRCWAGWRVAKVAPNQAGNPFATPLTGSVMTNVGVWAFNYQSTFQNTSNNIIFPGKTVPARFGSPWAGTNYQLNVPAITGTNGIQKGYQVLTHLANLPFTQEYISVKLCQLFVHDNFTHGSYDYTDPNMSAEARLVHDCMVTWQNSSPKGQIRPVLQTIFNSELFRSQSVAQHKVKTPLEYCVSAIRALRSSTNGTSLPGSYSSDTDGYSISGTLGSLSYPLNRMGGMLLFDRNDPNGYPEDAPGWISGGTLAERVRFVQSYLMGSGDSSTSKNDSISGGNKNVSDPMALMRLKFPLLNPPGSLTSASNVADYFVGILYPGEGKANLELYRKAAINFLNTGDDGVTSSPFSSLTSDNADTRVRGMVSMLMSFQRFNEQ
jgi:uncharacterized protein (DUF1800 family)